MTIKEAARKWVIEDMAPIPRKVIEKLREYSDYYDIVSITPDVFELPAWGTMWAFTESSDNNWLNDEENRQKMIDCGFNIYKSEDYRYVFGIDGGGYSFYEAHWIPLYKARGFHWHDEE